MTTRRGSAGKGEVRRERSAALLLVLAYAGFASIGLPDGLLGVAAPSILASFGLGLDALGALLVSYTAGYLAASVASGRVLARHGVGSVLAWSCFATAASLLGYALAQRWVQMVAFGSLAGFGAGAVDAGLNTFAATRHGVRTLNCGVLEQVDRRRRAEQLHGARTEAPADSQPQGVAVERGGAREIVDVDVGLQLHAPLFTARWHESTPRR